MLAAPRAATADEMPVLDLTPPLTGETIAGLARQLRHACETTGFFYVKNHGVPQGIIDDAVAAARRYFALPLEQRMGDKVDDRFRRGYTPLSVNAQHPGFEPDLKESYAFALDLPLDDPDVAARKPLHGPNRWPDHSPWLRGAADAYYAETLKLGKTLLRIVARSLDLSEDFFLGWCDKPIVRTSFFHYPPQPPMAPDAQMGVAPHTDYGMITILTQDPVGGLELRKRDGEWVGAPYIDGTFVINIGDLLAQWTNDVYVSNLHRVVNRSGRERYSIPTFFNLNFDTAVAVLPTCRSPSRPAKYEPTTVGKYLVSQFAVAQKLKA
jgi:isopenicillin N synthase-like dioxygenase